MAIGTDNRLKSSLVSPLSKKPKAPMKTPPRKTPAYSPMMKLVDQGAVDDVNNNVLAGAAGSGRMAMQDMAGRGLSAGRGQQARADMAQENAVADAALKASQNNQQADQQNKRKKLAYDTALKSEDLANQGLLQQLRMSGFGEDLARQGFEQDMIEAKRRGQLGLDSIFNDFTPLLRGLR